MFFNFSNLKENSTGFFANIYTKKLYFPKYFAEYIIQSFILQKISNFYKVSLSKGLHLNNSI